MRNKGRVLLFFGPIIAGAAGVFALSYYVASDRTSAGQSEVTQAASPTVEEYGAFFGRGVLGACIQADGVVDTQVFVDAVDAIVARLSLHPTEDIDRFEGAYAVQGCPPHELTGERLSGRGEGGKYVDTASEFRLFIYVIDAELFEAAFGEAPYGETTAEYVCSGDSCIGVTAGLYLTSLDPDVLFEAVADGLGLVGVWLPPPPTAVPTARAQPTDGNTVSPPTPAKTIPPP